MFDFISESGRFSEPVARYYMHQFMNGLKHCHDAQITHRDLKPENIFLDSNHTLKIADFGFAGPVQGRDGQGNLATKCGTLNYMAPEIHLGMPYKGQLVDIFASGIIMFMMVSATPPFNEAKPTD